MHAVFKMFLRSAALGGIVKGTSPVTINKIYQEVQQLDSASLHPEADERPEDLYQHIVDQKCACSKVATLAAVYAVAPVIRLCEHRGS